MGAEKPTVGFVLSLLAGIFILLGGGITSTVGLWFEGYQGQYPYGGMMGGYYGNGGYNGYSGYGWMFNMMNGYGFGMMRGLGLGIRDFGNLRAHLRNHSHHQRGHALQSIRGTYNLGRTDCRLFGS